MMKNSKFWYRRERSTLTSPFALRPSHRGFTLIELLVVVAIIALLVSILLPSLARARQQAKTVLCMSNARQIALAMHYYAQDYDGQFPVYCNVTLFRAPERFGFDGYWTDKLISGSEPWNGGYLPEPEDKTWSGYGSYFDGVWLCPEIPKSVVWAGGGGYAVNLIHVIEDKRAGFLPTPTKMHHVKRPSDIWLVGDGQPSTLQYAPFSDRYYGSGLGYMGCPVYYDWKYGISAGGQPGGRHNGGAMKGLIHEDVNIAFIDSHVETWNWEDTYQNKRNLFAHDVNNPPTWDGVYE